MAKRSSSRLIQVRLRAINLHQRDYRFGAAGVSYEPGPEDSIEKQGTGAAGTIKRLFGELG
jgi:hypothetical protein